jgi:hypothetical protein
MKSPETITSRARSAALEIFNSMGQSELERVLDLGLPSTVFAKLASQSKPLASSKRKPYLICTYSAPNGLSGRKPVVFVNGELSEEEKIAAITETLFELGRNLTLWDIADLEAWIDDELQLTLFEVNPRFLNAYSNDSSMLKIKSDGSLTALGSFGSLKRLVLTDD